jgi:hypothetical protein
VLLLTPTHIPRFIPQFQKYTPFAATIRKPAEIAVSFWSKCSHGRAYVAFEPKPSAAMTMTAYEIGRIRDDADNETLTTTSTAAALWPTGTT